MNGTLLLSPHSQHRTATLEQWKKDAELIQRLQASQSNWLKDLPHLRWQWARKLLTAADGNKFAECGRLIGPARSCCGHGLQSSLICEQGFSHLRGAETRGRKGKAVSMGNVISLTVKARGEGTSARVIGS